jgi:hypothetical protein
MDGDGDYTGTTPVPITVLGGAVLRFVDMDHDAGVANYTFSTTTVGNGMKIVDVDGIATPATGIALTMNLTYESSVYDESPAAGESFWFDITGYKSSSNYYVDLSTNADNAVVLYEDANFKQNEFYFSEPQDVDNHKMGMLTYGTKIDHYNPTGTNDPDEILFAIPEEQVAAQIFVVAGTVESTASSGSVETETVNPIAVGLAVLDSNAPAVGSSNLIVVGGPCANTVAAELMGNPTECAAGFEAGKAMIKSFESNGKVAILVAGYEAQETVGASYVLANYADYAANFKGSEVEVVVPDMSNLVVQAVTNE